MWTTKPQACYTSHFKIITFNSKGCWFKPNYCLITAVTLRFFQTISENVTVRFSPMRCLLTKFCGNLCWFYGWFSKFSQETFLYDLLLVLCGFFTQYRNCTALFRLPQKTMTTTAIGSCQGQPKKPLFPFVCLLTLEPLWLCGRPTFNKSGGQPSTPQCSDCIPF